MKKKYSFMYQLFLWCGLFTTFLAQTAAESNSICDAESNSTYDVESNGIYDDEAITKSAAESSVADNLVDTNEFEIDRDNNEIEVVLEEEKEILGSYLVAATWEEDIEKARHLIECGAPLNIQTIEGGHTPLMYAVREKTAEMAYMLLTCTACTDDIINVQNDNGNTALMCAILSGNTKTACMLLEAGALTHMQNENGDTALILAAKTNNVILVRELLKAGAATDIANQKGATALLKALEINFRTYTKKKRNSVEGRVDDEGRVEGRADDESKIDDKEISGESKNLYAIVEMLILARADVSLENKKKRTIFTMAPQPEFKTIIFKALQQRKSIQIYKQRELEKVLHNIVSLTHLVLDYDRIIVDTIDTPKEMGIRKSIF